MSLDKIPLDKIKGSISCASFSKEFAIFSSDSSLDIYLVPLTDPLNYITLSKHY